MNYFEAVQVEARTVAEQLRPVLNGTGSISKLNFEQHENKVAAVFWNGHHYQRAILSCPVPAAQYMLAAGGFESTRLRWRYQDAVADALLIKN